MQSGYKHRVGVADMRADTVAGTKVGLQSQTWGSRYKDRITEAQEWGDKLRGRVSGALGLSCRCKGRVA